MWRRKREGGRSGIIMKSIINSLVGGRRRVGRRRQERRAGRRREEGQGRGGRSEGEGRQAGRRKREGGRREK